MNDQQINQVIELLSQIASPETTCVVWKLCMTTSEWAGWAQVFGALLAIGISAKYVHYQLAAEKKNREQSAKNQIAILIYFMEKSTKPLTDFDIKNPTIKLYDFKLASMHFNELITSARDVKYSELNLTWATSLEATKFICTSFIQDLNFCIDESLKIADEDEKTFASKYRNIISSLRDDAISNMNEFNKIKLNNKELSNLLNTLD